MANKEILVACLFVLGVLAGVRCWVGLGFFCCCVFFLIFGDAWSDTMNDHLPVSSGKLSALLPISNVDLSCRKGRILGSHRKIQINPSIELEGLYLKVIQLKRS